MLDCDVTTVMANILIVDDDPNFCNIIAGFLRENGHVVAIAGDPQQCATEVRANKPDLVLLDIQLPGGGARMAMDILNQAKLDDARIIFCSGMEVEHMKRWFPETPRRGYVHKPLDLNALRAAVDLLLAKP